MTQYKVFETEEEWLKFRAKYFTASEASKLLPEPKKKGEILSVGAKTYILEKATADFAPPEPNYYNSAMEHGKETEPFAVLEIAKQLGKSVDDDDFIYTSFGGYVFFYDDEFNLGGTPDVIVKGLKMSCEVKCPNSETHLKYLLITSIDDIKAIVPQYYCQMQVNMYLTKTEKCLFFSYDNRFFDEKLHSFSIEIPYDSDYMDNLLNKAKEAKKYKEEIISTLKKRELCNA